jgi:integrase
VDAEEGGALAHRPAGVHLPQRALPEVARILLHLRSVAQDATYAQDALVKRAGVPMIRIHDMRHTSAALMLANGEHPRIVQERLGHADVSTTLNRYSHVTPDMQRDAADRLEAAIVKASEAAS